MKTHPTTTLFLAAFAALFSVVLITNYEHRRQWIENRIRILSSLFSIDICAYSVMSNHYHIALKLCPDQSNDWTDTEIVDGNG